jgi:hypothetical protein
MSGGDKDDRPTEVIPRFPPFDFSNMLLPRKKRWKRTAATVSAAVLIVVLLVGGGFLWGRHTGAGTTAKASASSAHTAFLDICADSSEAKSERARFVYVKPEYLTDTIEQKSDNPDSRWCVFGNKLTSGLWWAVIYVGEDNPVYETLVAENGTGEHASRGVVIYRGLPPVTFSRQGWVGFLTPPGWTEFRTQAAAIRLADIADSLNSE